MPNNFYLFVQPIPLLHSSISVKNKLEQIYSVLFQVEDLRRMFQEIEKVSVNDDHRNFLNLFSFAIFLHRVFCYKFSSLQINNRNHHRICFVFLHSFQNKWFQSAEFMPIGIIITTSINKVCFQVFGFIFGDFSDSRIYSFLIKMFFFRELSSVHVY